MRNLHVSQCCRMPKTCFFRVLTTTRNKNQRHNGLTLLTQLKPSRRYEFRLMREESRYNPATTTATTKAPAVSRLSRLRGSGGALCSSKIYRVYLSARSSLVRPARPTVIFSFSYGGVVSFLLGFCVRPERGAISYL